ncbi:hypothetical protein WJX84_003510 [Apatococcus fuscideae]
MEGSKFAKLCKDCGLVDKKLSSTDVDLIFAKAKAKGAQKIAFSDFENALSLVAEKKGVSVEDIKSKIASTGGPKMNNTTQPDYVKFHDDKSTYTGVYAAGGPTNVDSSQDLKDLADRSPANIRGVSGNFANSH